MTHEPAAASRLAVIGAGSMGAQIAQQAALRGLETGDERFRPSPALEAKVRAGELGRKSGRGWYAYPKEDS